MMFALPVFPCPILLVFIKADIGNFVLQAKGAKVLKVPYVCSGGVADGKQLAAALALGAAGVNLGTRFCVTKEGNWPQSFKERAVKASEEETVLLFRRLHNTARVFGNRVAKEAKAIEDNKGKDLQFGDLAELVAGSRGRKAERDGDPENGIWSAGQSVGLIDDIPTVQELMKKFMDEAVSTVEQRLVPLISKL
jgi:NADH:quinone reductase (non-electrogenic)